MNKQQFSEAEVVLLKKIAALETELETMQPNMHASDRLDGVDDKLKECYSDLGSHLSLELFLTLSMTLSL